MCKNDRRRKKSAITTFKKNLKNKNKIQKPKTKNQKKLKFFIFFCKITLLISLQLSKNSYGNNEYLVEK